MRDDHQLSGEDLHRLRVRAGLTKGDAARLAGVAPATWAAWEDGERAIPRLAQVALLVLIPSWIRGTETEEVPR
jgi:DNA-binding transcriptional regulator YiaG